jgi:hypothetical protein
MWETAAFVLELAERAVISGWNAMGTSGLGWVIGLATPILVVIKKVPKRRGWFAVLKANLRSEIKDVLVVYLCVMFTVFFWEFLWVLPREIRNTAMSISIPILQYHIPSAPEPPPPAPPATRAEIRFLAKDVVFGRGLKFRHGLNTMTP